MKSFIYITLSLFILTLIGCSQMNKKLNVIIKNNNLCFFTNDPDTDYYDSNKELLIYMSKLEHKKEIATIFEKKYINRLLPIKQENCLEIPLNQFKKDIAYSVVLDISHTYVAEICLKSKNNQLILKEIVAGETSCPTD